MISQEEVNDVCNIMYRMRDCINANDVRRSLDLSKQLYDMLLKMTVNHEQLKCILECEIKDKEK